jgi:hypothetical protein
MIYCDSSALVKLLVVEEPESEALDEWLSRQRSVQLASTACVRREPAPDGSSTCRGIAKTPAERDRPSAKARTRSRW